MASFIYLSFYDDVLKGNIDCDTDTFKVLLCTSAYTPNQTTQTKRSDITNEVSGTGYTAGGNTATVTVSKSTGSLQNDANLGGTTWAASTITARYAVYYKSRGGLATADELVAVVDFGSDVITTAGLFTLTGSIARIQL